jgi:DNA topoisomerase-1
VTDGETNATLRLGDAPETMTIDRASELLAERRNAEPSTRPRKAATKTTKKAPSKSGAKSTKKAAKKTTKKAAKKTTGATKRAAVAQGAQANAAILQNVQREDDE